MQLQGSIFSQERAYYQFAVQKCVNGTTAIEKTCASQQDIDDYVSDIQVEHWVQEAHVDFSVYDKKPVFEHLSHISSNLLEPTRMDQHVTTIRVNEIETEDDWFDFG